MSKKKKPIILSGGGFVTSPNKYASSSSPLTRGINYISNKNNSNQLLKNAGGSFAPSGGGFDASGLNVGGIVSGGVDLVNNYLTLSKAPDTKDLQESINSFGKETSNAQTNEQLMNEWLAKSNMKEISYDDVGGITKDQATSGVLKGVGTGAATGAAIGSIIPGVGTVIGGAAGALIGGIGSWFGAKKGKNKAQKAQADLNEQRVRANNAQFDGLVNKIGAIDTKNDFGMASNYFATGGHTKGGLFTNGVDMFNNGGTHEQNPLGGIPIGVNEEGVPNLVEEDEVRYNNYVFSNRLTPDEQSVKDSGLHKKYIGKSFAQIAKLFNKESEERPNDPISQNGLKDSMQKLMLAQESLKMRKQKKQQLNLFDLGGYINNKGKVKDLGYIGLDNSALMINQYMPTSDPLSRGIKYTDNRINSDRIIKQAHVNSAKSMQDTFLGPNKNKGSWVENLRYAPVVGSALSVAHDLINNNDGPDYSKIDALDFERVNAGPGVSPKPIGNYLTYQPLDREYHQNKLNALSSASRRAIQNSSGGNRAQATAGILASDYNALSQTGDLARRAEEYNEEQRERVEGFNRQTNMFNSQQALQADIHNSSTELQAGIHNSGQSLRTNMFKTQLAQDLENNYNATRSANLTNLFDNIGEVGRESFARNMIVSNPALYYTIDSSGNISYKNMDNLSPQQQKQVKEKAKQEAANKRNEAYRRGMEV